MYSNKNKLSNINETGSKLAPYNFKEYFCPDTMNARLTILTLAFICGGTLCSLSQTSPSPSNLEVRFNTTVGNIDVTLYPGNTPKTVANFMRYVNARRYEASLFHRSVTNFVIQGGGYFVSDDTYLDAVATYPAVTGEGGLSNVAGTISMALSSGPNSGTSQWFFNEADNSALLDGTTDGGPFTVFGAIANPASLAVMNQIGAETIVNDSANLGSAFSSLPVINYTSGELQFSNLILVNYITQLNPPIYFQNGTSLGALTLNTSFLPSAWQGIGAMNTGWQERAVADINGDGIPDLIFQNGTSLGALTLDAMGNPVSWIGIGAMGTGWELRGAADINGDGQSELIFQNGVNLGFLTISTAGVPISWTGIGAMGAGWELRAVADINADGQPDLVFQNGTSLGALQIGTNGLPIAWFSMGSMNTGWILSYAADLNADGQVDLVFQNGTTLGALQVNTSYQATAWAGIGAMGTGWTLPGNY